MSQATIKDIAKQLHISPSTVSRALRNHPDISTATKEKVQESARKLHYQPNLIAQNLKRKSSNVIGVIVPQVKHYFFAAIMGGITDIAYEAGYTVMICQSNENFEREIINARALMSQRVAGILVSISQATMNYEHYEMIQQRGIPIVFFDRTCDKIVCSKVTVNDYQGAYNAVEYLVNKGYKRIAHLSGPEHMVIGEERLRGYRDALIKNNININEDFIVYGGLNEEDGVTSYLKLKERNVKPDAVFCVTDPVAVGVYTKIREDGLKIPDDIALVGFSDNPIASLIEPSLTTVHQPAYEIGKAAASLLLMQIKHKKMKPQHIVLDTELVIRKST